MNERTIEILAGALPQILLAGLQTVIPMTALAFCLSLAVATGVALVQYANVPVLRQICRFYIWIMRGTPVLVQLAIVYFGLPSIGIRLPAFAAAVLVFGFNEGAYSAETIRGALEAVPKGQMEAGACVGMSWLQTMWHIVLPQAMRAAVPPLGNSLIAMLKETSLASNITVGEMYMMTQRINGRVYEPLLLYCALALVYLLFCTAITWLQRFVERRMKPYENG